MGPFNAGKTTFIRTLTGISMTTDVEVTSAEERKKKRWTTVGMDFGMVDIGDGYVIRLFGSPGQARFSFMWKVLSVGAHGIIFMLDASDRESIQTAQEEFRRATEQFAKLPMVVAANKQDVSNALKPEDVRFILGVPSKVRVLPCVAIDKAQAWLVLGSLLELIMPQESQIS